MTLLQRELKDRYVVINNTPTKVSSVYIGNGDSTATKIRPAGYTPGANTLAYYPLQSDVKDYKANGTMYDGTIYGAAVSYGKIGGCTNNAIFIPRTRIQTDLITMPKTINLWIYKPTTGTGDGNYRDRKQLLGFNSADGGGALCLRRTAVNSSSNEFRMYIQVGSSIGNTYNTGVSNDQRHNICIVTNGTYRKLYYDNTLVITNNSGGFGTAQTGLWRGTAPYNSLSGGSDNYSRYGYMSELILESVEWDETKRTDYYNQTKSNYGL